ncbi:MAG: NitT/TauT family transport system substrate-binding protein [Verrucomicrobiales bacterium]|jgi:NitT/TauT family transport system substrate-binding protein
MNKSILSSMAVGLSILAVLVLSSCGPESDDVGSTAKPSDEVMKVGKYYWPSNYWLEVAEKKGWFAEAGLNVKLVDTNPDYYASQVDVAEGRLDTQDFYLYDLMKFNAEGAELVMVLNVEVSSGSEGMAGKIDIGSVAELKGRSIGVGKGSALAYMVDVALTRHGLTPADVTLIDIQPEKAVEAFAAGKCDAVVTWEPYLSQIAAGADARKIFDTSDIPGVSPAGYAFHRDFIEARPADVQAFIGVWYRTRKFIKANPKESYEIIAKNYDLEASEVEEFTKLLVILDLEENLTAFSYAAGFESLFGTAQEINTFMIRTGVAQEPLDSEKFLDGSFIQELNRSH